VREWLLDLKRDDRRTVGQDLKTAQYGWPLGQPLIRKPERVSGRSGLDLRTRSHAAVGKRLKVELSS
jgi:hypothetical protein